MAPENDHREMKAVHIAAALMQSLRKRVFLQPQRKS